MYCEYGDYCIENTMANHNTVNQHMHLGKYNYHLRNVSQITTRDKIQVIPII